MDDKAKIHLRDAFIANGGETDWISGNQAADRLAELGSQAAAPPSHLRWRDHIVRKLANTVQQMYVHIWAAHIGAIDAPSKDTPPADHVSEELEDPFDLLELADPERLCDRLAGANVGDT